MMHRRDLLIGGACVAAAAAGVGLKPHRRVSLLGRDKLNELIPLSFAGWTGQDVSELVATDTPDSLTALLYQQLVERVYVAPATGSQVMMLLAHGDSQTEQLQLHRPERCYPAFGFTISGDRETQLPVGGGATIPARSLVANGAGRQETIVYWARIGEQLPTSVKQQQVVRVEAAMRGHIVDGMLARFSVVGQDPAASLAVLNEFIPQLVRAVRPDKRRVLIGSTRADAIASLQT